MELNLRVFRTYKGEIEQGIFGSVELRNPDVDKRIMSKPVFFRAKEFQIDQKSFPRKLEIIDRDGKVVAGDLFEDLVNSDGQLEVIVRCLEPAQYFGMAQADVYVRALDAPFWANFVKGYAGIWLQMIMVTSFGVMFSTFLNAAVSMIATFGCVVLGFFSNFISGVFSGDVEGGGLIESLIRLVTQMNLTNEFSDSIATKIVHFLDGGLLIIMQGVGSILPNYGKFNTTDYVAYGFNIYGGLLGRHFVIGMIYVLATTAVGYFFLKTREVAA